jgi:hypothetical protein
LQNPYNKKSVPTTPFVGVTAINPYKTTVQTAKEVQFITPATTNPYSKQSSGGSTIDATSQGSNIMDEPAYIYFAKWSKELQKDCPRLMQQTKFKAMLERWRNEAIAEQERDKRGYDAITPSGIENRGYSKNNENGMDFNCGAVERQRKACRYKWSFER